MSNERRQIEAALEHRVYEYTGDDGATYWSLTKKKMIVSPPLRLTLKSRIGVHVINFVARLRRISGAKGPANG